MNLMNALVCDAPGTLRLEQRARPSHVDAEVLVRPRRIGICGTDYHIFEGKHPFLQYPRVMGHELAVEIVDAPPASGFAPGDTTIVNPYLSCGHCIACSKGKPNCCTSIAVLGVHRDGGMAEYLSLPLQNLIPAEGLSLDACATVEFLAIGAHAVRRSQIRPGDRALVSGAGPIGLGVGLFAMIAGADVTIADCDAKRVAGAVEMGGAVRGEVAAKDAPREKSGKPDEGYDVVFDATGNVGSIEAGFTRVAHGGTYVLVSVVKDVIKFADSEFHKREMSLLGSRNATTEDFRKVIEALASGRVPLDRIITHRTTLEKATIDLPRWAADKEGLVKAVIEIP